MLTLYFFLDRPRLSRSCAFVAFGYAFSHAPSTMFRWLGNLSLDIGLGIDLELNLRPRLVCVSEPVMARLLSLSVSVVTAIRRQGCPQDQALVQGRRSRLQDPLW